MHSVLKKVCVLFLSIFLWVSSACSKHSQEAAATSSATLSMTGKAQLGPIQNAEVKIYLLGETGQVGALIASTFTSSSGTYTISIPDGWANYPVLVVITGGNYREESSGALVSLTGREIKAVASASENRVVSVTPLTHMAAERAIKTASAGGSLSMNKAIENANYAVAKAAGLTGITDITTVVPANPTTTLAEQGYTAASVEAKYALFLAGISEQAAGLGVDSGDLAIAFAEDFLSDGKLDGQGASGTVEISSSQSLGATSWSGLANDQLDFISSHGTLGFASNGISLPDSEPPLVSEDSGADSSAGTFFKLSSSASTSQVVDPAIDGYFRFTIRAPSADYRGTIQLIDTVGGNTELYTDVFPVGSGTPNQMSAFTYTFVAADKGVKSLDINFLTAGTHKIQVVDTSYTNFTGVMSLEVSVGAPYSFGITPDSAWGTTNVCQRITLNIFDYGGNETPTRGLLQLSTTTVIQDDSFNVIGGAEALFYTSQSHCQNGTSPVTSLSLANGAAASSVVLWTKTSTAGYSFVSLDVSSDNYGSILSSGQTNAYTIMYVQ